MDGASHRAAEQTGGGHKIQNIPSRTNIVLTAPVSFELLLAAAYSFISHSFFQSSDISNQFKLAITLKMNYYWKEIRFAILGVIASKAFVAAFQVTPRTGIRYYSGGMKENLAPQSFVVRPTSKLFFYDREADGIEQMIGGTRYEMVELPDCLVDTTIFVGNLCEFVTDEMLSEVFRKASSLNFVPACVARKPNSSSLKYGFVTFPTVAEKEVRTNLTYF